MLLEVNREQRAHQLQRNKQRKYKKTINRDPHLTTHTHTNNHVISLIVIHLLATSAFHEKNGKKTIKMLVGAIEQTTHTGQQYTLIRIHTRYFLESDFDGGRFSLSFSSLSSSLFSLNCDAKERKTFEFFCFSQRSAFLCLSTCRQTCLLNALIA